MRFYQVIYGKLVQYEGGPIVPRAGHQRTAWSRGLPPGLLALCTPEGFNLKPKTEWRDSPWKDSPYGFALLFHECEGEEWALLARAKGMPEGTTSRLYTHAHFLITRAADWRPEALADVQATFNYHATVAGESDQLPALEITASKPPLNLPKNWVDCIRSALIHVLSGQTHSIDPQGAYSEPACSFDLIRVCLAALPPVLSARCPVGVALGCLTEIYAIGHASTVELQGEPDKKATFLAEQYVEWLSALPLAEIGDTEQLAAAVAREWNFLQEQTRTGLGWKELAKLVRDNIPETQWLSELRRALNEGTIPRPMQNISARRGEVLEMLLADTTKPAALATLAYTSTWEKQWSHALTDPTLAPLARPWGILWGYKNPGADDISVLVPLVRDLLVPEERKFLFTDKLTGYFKTQQDTRLWLVNITGATGILREWAVEPKTSRRLLEATFFQASGNRVQLGRGVKMLRDAIPAAAVFDPEASGTIDGANMVAEAFACAPPGTVRALFQFFEIFPAARPSAINMMLLQLAFDQQFTLREEFPVSDSLANFEQLAAECAKAPTLDPDIALLLLAKTPLLLDERHPALRERFAALLGGAAHAVLGVDGQENIGPNYPFILLCVTNARDEFLPWWLERLMRLVDFELPSFEAEPGTDAENSAWEKRWRQLCNAIRKLLARCTRREDILADSPTAHWLAYFLQILTTRPENPEVLPDIRRRLVFLLTHISKSGTGSWAAARLAKSPKSEVEVLLSLYASDPEPYNTNIYSHPPGLPADQFADLMNELAELLERDGADRVNRDWRRLFNMQPQWGVGSCWRFIHRRVVPPKGNAPIDLYDEERKLIGRLSARNIAFLLINNFRMRTVEAELLRVRSLNAQPLPPSRGRDETGVLALTLSSKPNDPLEIMHMTFKDLEYLARNAVGRRATVLVTGILELSVKERDRIGERRSTSGHIENYADLYYYCSDGLRGMPR